MNYEQLKDVLIKKIDHELFIYKQYLIKNETPEKIVESAYQITIKEQMRDILDGFIFDRDQIQVLLKTNNILDKLYDKYEHSDGNIWEVLEDNVREKIGEVTKEYNKNIYKQKVR